MRLGDFTEEKNVIYELVYVISGQQYFLLSLTFKEE